MLKAIIGHLKQHNPAIRIVLDPVIRASSGKDFWEETNREGFDGLAGECWLVTPNWEEMAWLYPDEEIPAVSRRLSGLCNLYLKGGHHPQLPGRDYLWSVGELLVLEPSVEAGHVYPKHGSGCVLSSALAANLSLGATLQAAAVQSKKYIEQFLTSNKTSLGWHGTLQK
jgi:hydroxymethylpyrimidine/phosphomethylpyrimidine kinase